MLDYVCATHFLILAIHLVDKPMESRRPVEVAHGGLALAWARGFVTSHVILRIHPFEAFEYTEGTTSCPLPGNAPGSS